MMLAFNVLLVLSVCSLISGTIFLPHHSNLKKKFINHGLSDSKTFINKAIGITGGRHDGFPNSFQFVKSLSPNFDIRNQFTTRGAFTNVFTNVPLKRIASAEIRDTFREVSNEKIAFPTGNLRPPYPGNFYPQSWHNSQNFKPFIETPGPVQENFKPSSEYYFRPFTVPFTPLVTSSSPNSDQNCHFTVNDFYENSNQKLFYCASSNNLIVKNLNGNSWCLGYFSEKAEARRTSLYLQLDKPFQIEFSPKNIVIDQTDNLELYFYFEPNILHTIFITGTLQELPKLTQILLDNKAICESEPIENQTQKPILTTAATTTEPHFQIDIRGHDLTTPTCGKRFNKHKTLISNPSHTSPGNWPFHAAIFHTTQRTFAYKCGGIVISNHLVLTAAHCVMEKDKEIIMERIKVHLGRHNIQNFDMHSVEYDVHETIIHPGFNLETCHHDIALLKVSSVIEFTRFIQPACLPEVDFELLEHIGTVVGWGRNENGSLSAVLNEARTYVPSTVTCLESHRDFYGTFLYDGNFCAGGVDQKSVACTGDSGGGLYFHLNQSWIVRGIVSIGVRETRDEGCETNHFVLYTDVYKHMQWIKMYLD